MTRPYAPGYRIPPDLLLKAYASGVFPMAESADDPQIFWVRPETRGIIPLDAFHVPRSLARTIRRGQFEITVDRDFEAVIDACAEARGGRENTWINAPIREAYVALHARGHCHSIEAWCGDELAGGLYGVSLGGAFFGESMFSRQRDASKVCLAYLVGHLREHGYALLDTQFTTEHLKRFGAIDVPRGKYEKMLARAIEVDTRFDA